MKLLKFSASWCGPCKMLSKTIEQVKDELDCDIIEIDIDDDFETANKFQIRGVPTLVLMDGETEVARKTGSMSAAELKNFVKK
jgi:thiol-disulfide isomerase/thioredoxin